MFGKKRNAFGIFTGVSIAAMTAASPALAQQQESPRASDEIVVTAEKREAAIQDVPLAVSAFSQDTLNALQISGGPNLQQAIPNVNFSKGNFTGSYNFQIRGIGAQLVAGGGDAGVGIHSNDIPLLANNLFDAEFYDTQRVEVLRGPQGTLYGRNATGGVVNIISAKPSNAWEGKLEGSYGDYADTRLEGMINVPLGTFGGLRVAAVDHQRDGFVQNAANGHEIDDRDQFAIRATIGGDFGVNARGWFLYEHFDEEDTRLRSGKQFCVTDPGPTTVGGVATTSTERRFLSQGCLGTRGSPLESRGVTNANSTLGAVYTNVLAAFGVPVLPGDYNAGAVTPGDRRTVYSATDPTYRARTDHYELNFQWDLTPNLTLNSLSSYTDYFILTSEDYIKSRPTLNYGNTPFTPGGAFVDPQLGRQTTATAFDNSTAGSKYYSQEFRLSSSYDGPVNFNVGAFYLANEGYADYYVFFNNSTIYNNFNNFAAGAVVLPNDPGNGAATPAGNINNTGRNYYINHGTGTLKSEAVFGEVYWDVNDQFRLTGGLRYTDDKKTQDNFLPLLSTPVTSVPGPLPYLPNGTSTVEFKETTGRFNASYEVTPDNLLYATFSRGYKAGGINPPPSFGVAAIFPTFEPEFINAYEVGSKNTFADGKYLLNLTGFYYDYSGYQVSQIINRTSLNSNIDAEIYGLELEAMWHVTDDFRLTGNVGYLHTEITGGNQVDTIDRTQGDPTLSIIKASTAANCVISTKGLAAVLNGINMGLIPENGAAGPTLLGACAGAFAGPAFAGFRTLTGTTVADFTPSDGKTVSLAGNELPQSPSFTASLAAAYTIRFNETWNTVLHADYYWQGESWGRIYNRPGFDEIPSRDNINLSIDLNNDPHQFYIRAFVKNLSDADDVVGTYLTDDSSGLFTNGSLVEPRTYGVTVGKKW